MVPRAMEFSLEHRTATLSVGEFSEFAPGPREPGGGVQGLWRAQLGQHWHNELRRRTEHEASARPATERPALAFEVPIAGTLVHKGWAVRLAGRIDQVVGPLLREIKTVTRPLPAEEHDLRADYPSYFLQLAAYVVLLRTGATLPAEKAAPEPCQARRAELVFVETGSGIVQTLPLTPFDEAVVFHQLDAVVEFLNLQARAAARRRSVRFVPPFAALRPGQETIQQDLAATLAPAVAGASEISNLKSENPPQTTVAALGPGESQISEFRSQILLLEAPTGYGKTGCVLEFALGRLRSGAFERLVWLTGKSTGQLQVALTLRQMTEPEACHTLHDKSRGDGAGTALAVWQVRNKGEHCVNSVFHCVRDACAYLAGCTERWPQSGLNRLYLDERERHDLETLKAAGREARICPYEITRAALPFNDVWIGDYNYVFAPDNRGLFFDQPGFDPARTLLVVDEAHNLPSRVADAYSHAALETDARLLLAELDHQRAPAALVLAVEEWTRLLAGLRPCEALEPPAEAEVHDLLGRLSELVSTHPLDYAALGPRHCDTLWQFPALEGFLADAGLRRLLWVPRTGELAFTCIDATEAIGDTLRQFGGAILMSATLTPFAHAATACGLAQPATLRAPAPWRAGAYDVAVDLRVDTTYRQRGGHYGTTAATVEALHAAAGTAAGSRESRVESREPGQVGNEHSPARGMTGPSTFDARPSTSCVAVFFPSYAYAEAVQRTLEEGGSPLRVALQPRLPDLAAQSAWMEESLVLSDAVFLVLGSSFSEGIDLLGGRVTHAMVVGPALPEVNAVQKARLEAFSGLGRDAAFRRVYQIPGLQKVNQALGRLVRAPGQRAKVLLHCRRFAETSYAALLAPEYQHYREIAHDDDLRAWLDGA